MIDQVFFLYINDLYKEPYKMNCSYHWIETHDASHELNITFQYRSKLKGSSALILWVMSWLQKTNQNIVYDTRMGVGTC